MTAVELLLLQRKSFFEGTEMVLAGIRPEMFDLRPFQDAMTFGEQVDHISEVEAELLDETAAALKFDKIIFAHKKSSNMPEALVQWRRICALGDEFIGILKDEQLDIRFMTTGHFQMSISAMINTVIEHGIHHRGEVIAYFRMVGSAPPKRWAD